MTYYYDPEQSSIRALLQWKKSSIRWVVQRPEFWLFLSFHIFLVISARANIVDWVPSGEKWKVNGAFQYFTTFFLTFYNSNCYQRYEYLYPCCMSVMDGVLLVVRELTVSFRSPDTWKHRLAATKYLLAGCYLFFFGLAQETLSIDKWSEVVKKGLLTKHEAQMLMKYPGGDVVPVVNTWVMIVLVDALKKDSLWRQRSQRVAHIHNRLNFLMVPLMRAQGKAAETMAMPIPFAYWHLMNLVFSLNFFLLAFSLASYRNIMTIIPYAMALLTFMGLREVSNALADPFGEDSVDFPLEKYLDFTFDQSVCLLQAFSHEMAYERVAAQIKETKPFEESQLRHTIPASGQGALYNDGFRAHESGTFLWTRETPLQRLTVDYVNNLEGLRKQLTESLAHLHIEPDDSGSASKELAEARRRQSEELTKKLKQLEVEVAELRAAAAAAPSPVSPAASPSAKDQLQRPDRSIQRRGWLPSAGGSEQDYHQFGAPGGFHRSQKRYSGRSAPRSGRAFSARDMRFEDFEASRQQIRQALESLPPPRSSGRLRSRSLSSESGATQSSGDRDRRRPPRRRPQQGA